VAHRRSASAVRALRVLHSTGAKAFTMFLYQPGTHVHTAFGRNPDVNRIPHARPRAAEQRVRRGRLATAGGLMLLLAACATPPPPADDPQGPLPLAAGWSDTAANAPQGQATLTERWWQAWQDPLLDQLVDEALQANPGLAGARATLARSRALREGVAAGLAPQLGSSASASRNRSAGRNSNSLSAALDASWEPDLSGAGAAAVAAAEAQARSADATLAASRLALAGDVAQAYLQWQGLRQRSRLAADNLAAQRESLQLAQWRAAAGQATSVEIGRAHV
jgi:outer membrane protein TolC